MIEEQLIGSSKIEEGRVPNKESSKGFGCSVSEDFLHIVMPTFESTSPSLNLSVDPPMKSYSPSQVEWYLQTNSIRFFVLVVHAKTVEHAYLHETSQKAQYEELFKTMLDRVAEKVIILVCDSGTLPPQQEAIIHQTIEDAVGEKEKVFISWIKNGSVTVDPDVLEQVLSSRSNKGPNEPGQKMCGFSRTN